MEKKGEIKELLTPEELAKRLKVPISWVYEQSRQGNIPTHRIGRYIRFDLREVLANQKTNLTNNQNGVKKPAPVPVSGG